MNRNEFVNKFRTVTASLPDRENCVCEIYYDNVEWAEISQETEDVIIQFYSNPSSGYWEFPLDVAIEILQRGKIKLTGSLNR